MAGEEAKEVTIQSLLESGAITGHKDGNHGSQYPRVEEFGSVGVPFLTAKSLSDGKIDIENAPRLESNKAQALRHGFVQPGDVLLSHNATVGRVAIVPDFAGQMLIGTSLTYFRVDASRILPRYLAAYFLGAKFQDQLAAVMSFSTRNQVPITAQRQLYVVIPPLSEQRAIARILGTLDDKINLNRRTNETLEGIARALFKSWFVDFDPVRATTEGLDLPKPLANLFPTRLVGSELGEIPEGWEVGCVDDDFELTMGQSPPGETYNESGEGLPFFQGSTDFGFRFPTRRVYCTAPTRFAKRGDTLISVRAPVGDINMASENCAIGRGLAAGRHRTGSRSYSYQFMRSLKQVFAGFEAEGTVFGSISKKDFHAIACVMPPRELVINFERRLEPVDNRIDVNERESRTLADLRDTLLPKLISGELRIKDAERFVEAVA